MPNLLEQDVVFYHQRADFEHFAASVEATKQMLYAPEVRRGDAYLDSVLETFSRLEDFCRQMIDEADRQTRDECREGELALDRDATRSALYGVLHCLKCIKDGKEETLFGEEPHVQLTGYTTALWLLCDRWEEERRNEVYERLERTLSVEASGQNLIGSLSLPTDWDTSEPVPEE